MVKSPKIRHSKPVGEPLTIELGRDDVTRVDAKDEPGKEKAQGASSSSTSSSDSTATDKAAGKGSATTASAAQAAPKPSASQGFDPKSAGTADAAKPAGSSTFGRDVGRTTPPPSGQSKPNPTQPASPTAPKPASAPQRRSGSMVLAGLIGGVIALGGAGAAWYGGLLQPPAPPAQPAPPAVDDSAVERLRAELDTLRAAIDELRAAPPATGETPDLSGVNSRIESLAALVEDLRAQISDLSGAAGDPTALAGLREALAALEARVAALPFEGGQDMSALREEIGTATTLARQASEAAGAITPRVERIETELSELATRIAEAAERPGVALAIAASALKSAIDRGLPFTAELDTVAGLAPDMPEIEALRAYAATGVASRADLDAEIDRAATAIIAAGRAESPEAGLFARLWASAMSVVEVRPIGEVEGEDVPAIVARMEVALRRGDLARAVAEYESLPEAAQTAGASYIEAVRARLAADELVAKVLAAALRA